MTPPADPADPADAAGPARPPASAARPPARGCVTPLRIAGRALLAQPRAAAWIAPVLWATGIAALSSSEDLLDAGLGLPEWLEVLLHDLGHPLAFGVLALLLVPLLPRLGNGAADRWVVWSRGGAAAILALVVAYGLVDEWRQSYVPGRFPSLLDVLSDGVGAACVLWIVGYLGRSDATHAGVQRRLAACVLACFLAAALSGLVAATLGTGLWPLASPA